MASPKSIDDVFEACGLVWEQSQNLVLCQRCRYALCRRGSQITHHLHSKHRVPLPLRKGLTTGLRDHPVRFQEPASASPRPDGSPADARLQLLAGYACRRCLYRTVSRDLIRRHLSQEHLQQQRASDRRANGLYDDVYLQTWSQSSSRQYWTVIHQGQAIRPMAPNPAVDAHLASVHLRERARLQAEEATADFTTTGLQTVEATRPWMERTRWPQVYEGVRRDLLQSLTGLPYSTTGSVDLLLAPQDGGDPIVSPALDHDLPIWSIHHCSSRPSARQSGDHRRLTGLLSQT